MMLTIFFFLGSQSAKSYDKACSGKSWSHEEEGAQSWEEPEEEGC